MCKVLHEALRDLCPQHSQRNDPLVVFFLHLLCRQLQSANEIDLATLLQLAAFPVNSEGFFKGTVTQNILLTHTELIQRHSFCHKLSNGDLTLVDEKAP